MPTPWIVVRQAINDAHLGMTSENRWNVDDGYSLQIEGRNYFKGLQKRMDFCRGLWLKSADHHILPAFFASARLVEHSVRLAHPGGIAEKHFQAATRTAPTPAGGGGWD